MCDEKVSPKDELGFLSDYLTQTRRDIIADKTTLSRIFTTKVLVIGSVAASFATKFSDLAVAVLPVVLFSLDFLYRKRLNEIMNRWQNLYCSIVPKIKELAPSFSAQEFFFEDVVKTKRVEILNEERDMKTWPMAISLFFGIPAAVQFARTDIAIPDVFWGAVLFAAIAYIAIYCIMFKNVPTFEDTYSDRFLYGAIVVSGLGLCILQFGFHDLSILSLIFPSG